MTNQLEVVAWINKDGTYVDLATKSTVYGSHTIPLVRQSDALEVIAELEKDVLANAKDAARYRLVCLLDNTIDAQIERVQGEGK